MTKLEALAKDCIENHTHRLVDKPTKQDFYLREESIFIQGYRQSEKRIEELEQENAELKDELKDANEKVVHLTCNQNKDLKYKLTKAKDLLAKWVELYQPKSDTFLPTPIQVDTEQFLSEVEK